jgi:hypothetical protein
MMPTLVRIMSVEKVKIEFEVSLFHAEMLKALARLTLNTTNGVARELVEAILDDDEEDNVGALRN